MFSVAIVLGRFILILKGFLSNYSVTVPVMLTLFSLTAGGILPEKYSSNRNTKYKIATI